MFIEKKRKFPTLTIALEFIERKWGFVIANDVRQLVEEIKNNEVLMERASKQDMHCIECVFDIFTLVFYTDKSLVKVEVKP